jgi:hypothetical protein
MNGSEYPHIQVTDDQLEAFRIWATDKYGNYLSYYESLQSVELTQYIRGNILSNEMNHILLQTDMYVGTISNDPHLKSLQIRRQSILLKMGSIKIRLGRRVFAEEVAARRAHQEELFRQRLLIRSPEYVVEPDDNLMPINTVTTRKIVRKKLAEAEKHKSMAENCAICLIKHKMMTTCVIPCGHQFGSKCFASWKNNTCPLCRTPCMVVTEFVAPKRRRYLTDEEADMLSQVHRQVASP